MDVYECIRTRRTAREFKPDPVPEAIVQKILQAGRWAPSSSNTQPWHFVVVSARETIAALGRIATQGPFIGQAPLAIAIVMAHANRPQLDAGRALQQMELMAWSEGLGTCFVGLRAAEQHDAIKTLLKIPAEMELITVMPFGYRLEGRRAHGTPRKPMAEIAHREQFGTAYVPPTEPAGAVDEGPPAATGCGAHALHGVGLPVEAYVAARLHLTTGQDDTHECCERPTGSER